MLTDEQLALSLQHLRLLQDYNRQQVVIISIRAGSQLLSQGCCAVLGKHIMALKPGSFGRADEPSKVSCQEEVVD